MTTDKAEERGESCEHHHKPDRPDAGGEIGLGPWDRRETIEEGGHRHEGTHPPRRLDAHKGRAETGGGVGGNGELREFQRREIGRSDGVAELVVQRPEKGRDQGGKAQKQDKEGEFSETGHGRGMRGFVDAVTGQRSGVACPAKARMPGCPPRPSSFPKYAHPTFAACRAVSRDAPPRS
jgi:hypothetical protein